MARDFTQAEVNQHNALTARGWALTKGRLLLHGAPSEGLGWFSPWQLRRAIRCFENALAINSEGWSSMWALGKIHQRLGDQTAAFDWFAKAHAINPDQPDVAREASIAALDIGRVAEALALCRAALASKPGDSGLVCNLALAHCLAGQDEDAEKCAAEATGSDPSDEISANVLAFVRDVGSGRKRGPRNSARFSRMGSGPPPNKGLALDRADIAGIRAIAFLAAGPASGRGRFGDLPDGLEGLRHHNLVTFKSRQGALGGSQRRNRSSASSRRRAVRVI